jgi:2-methylcitrate dehydratase PrpD
MSESADVSAGATRKLAGYAASLSYGALPLEIVNLTKQCILDTLGVTIGASTLAPEAALLREHVVEQSGAHEASLLGFGGKSPAGLAAFLNGSMGHMLDYDDAALGVHPGIVTVPVAMALAEKQGGVSGRELLAAVSLGCDIAARAALAARGMQGFFGTQLHGFIAGAAAGGRVMGLSEDEMLNAFAIAFTQLCGSSQLGVGDGTHLRGMQAGFSGQGAVLAVLLAKRGIAGSGEAFEGRYGLFKTYARVPEPDWDALVGELGTRFVLPEHQFFKIWPACAVNRPLLAAIGQLQEDFAPVPDDIASVTVGGVDSDSLWEPAASKRRPRTGIDAKFSAPFTAAVALQKGTVTLGDYTEDGLDDPAVLALAERVQYAPSEAGINGPTRLHEVNTGRGIYVELTMRNGEKLRRDAGRIPGDPNNPVKQAQLEAKSRDCVGRSLTPVPPANVERAIELIANLEQVEDATGLMRLLVPSGR